MMGTVRYLEAMNRSATEAATTRRLTEGQIEVVDEDVAAILRQKAPWERVAMMSAAHRTMRLLVEGAIRSDHPDWDGERVRAAVARRMTRGAD